MKKIILALLATAALHAESDEYFYLNLGFGKASINYTPTTQASLDTLFPDSTNNAMGLDFGVYITLDDLLLGATLNGVSQNFSNNTTSAQIAYSITGLSAIYFLSSGHEGVFVRGDLGQAKYSATIGTVTGEKTGTGLLLGVGYKWWSIYGAINISSYTVEGQDSISSSMMNFGFMW